MKPAPAKEEALTNAPTGVETPASAVSAEVQFALGDDFDRNVWNVFGVAVDALDLAGAVTALEAAARTRRKLAFVTPNINMLGAARRREGARIDINAHDLSLADGAPLAAIARLLGAPLKERCAGSDLFDALRRRPTAPGRPLKVFFFGGRDGAAEAAHAALNEARGSVRSVGFLNPGFGDIDAMSAPETIAAINEAEPDFVLVALGAEKGNAWIQKNAAVLDAPLVSHLGAVVDFVAGGVERAPTLARRLGLEWAWRIYQEPSLWKRYWRDGCDLAGLCATRLLPLLMLRQKFAGAPADARIEETAAGPVVRLTGDLVSDDLATVRQAFRAAAAALTAGRGEYVTLDFSTAGALDSAFLGLVLMLEKHAARYGAVLQQTGGAPALARFIALSGINLPEAPEQGGEEWDREDVAGRAQRA